LAFGSNISEKWVLVIDDMEGMRSQLRMSLSSSGFARLHVVGRIKDALDRMESNRYDVILCDYSLGEGTDGQQFLEYLRTNDLIARNTIFVMITAEQSYEKVVVASECAPDDYLLKPFTAAQFNARLEKMLEKQEYFLPIDQATDAKNWPKVVAECDKKLAARDKYYLELCKIKGSALMRDDKPQEAAVLYRSILALRPVGWARLGLARALTGQGQNEEAIAMLREIVRDTPQFLAAYDLLGKLLNARGDKSEALEVLQHAREISPGTMSRIRTLSHLAVSAGKPEIAETVMREALHKHKYSPVRQANDYAVLSKALVNQGRAGEALSVLEEARKSFRDPHSDIVLTATESVAHRAAGNHELAAAALSKAMTSGDVGKLPPHVAVSIADACFAMGKEQEATDMLRHVVQNNHEDEHIKERVREAFTVAGKDSSEASAIVEESAREVILINNEGVRKVEEGKLEEAAELLCRAADRLPSNLQIVGNAALVVALGLVRKCLAPEMLDKCLIYRETLSSRAPNSPTLTKVNSLLGHLQK
jgi:CheY-like chemotaxis protein/predicted Zn-dependent protease